MTAFFGEPIDLPVWKRDITIAPGWTMRITYSVRGDQTIIAAGGPDKFGAPVFAFWRLGEKHLRAIEQMGHEAACRRVHMIGRLVSKAVARRVGGES